MNKVKNINEAKSSNNSIKNYGTPYIVSSLLTLFALSMAEKSNAQSNYMAPDDPCIATQIALIGNIAPWDTIWFKLSWVDWANLWISPVSPKIVLRRMINGVYASWPIAVTWVVWDTLVIIWTGSNWQEQVINYCDFDCDPACSSTNLILPVTRLSTWAEKQSDGTVEVKWAVAQEINNKEFLVERTTDLKNWKTIDEVQGRGDAADPKNYSVIDEQPYHGTNHYRIKQVDFDGNFSYSPISTAKIDNVNTKIALYPNPTSDFLTVEGDAIENIVVYDELGRKLDVKIDGNRIDLSTLSVGVFYVETTQLGNAVQMHRVVKTSK